MDEGTTENQESPNKQAFSGYYELLGVRKGATSEEIKQAYRNGIKESHPDYHPGDQEAEERTKKLNEAYRVLSNDQSRLMYDKQLEQMAAAAVSNRAAGRGYNFVDAMEMWYEQMFNDSSDIFGIKRSMEDAVRARREQEIKETETKGYRLGGFAAQMINDTPRMDEMLGILEAIGIEKEDLQAVDLGLAHVSYGRQIRENFPGLEEVVEERLEQLRWARHRLSEGDWGHADRYLHFNAITGKEGSRVYLSAAEKGWQNVNNQVTRDNNVDRDKYWFVPEKQIAEKEMIK